MMIEVNCFVCEISFPSAQMFQNHVESEHSYICDQCNKIMSNKNALEVHKKKHIKETGAFNDTSTKINSDTSSIEVNEGKYDSSDEEALQSDNDKGTYIDTKENNHYATEDNLSDSDLDDDDDDILAESDTSDMVEDDNLSDSDVEFKSEISSHENVSEDGMSSDKNDSYVIGITDQTSSGKSDKDISESDNPLPDASSDELFNLKDADFTKKGNKFEINEDKDKIPNDVKIEDISDTNMPNISDIALVKDKSFDMPKIKLESESTDMESNAMKTEYEWTHEDPTVPIGWVTAWDDDLNEKQFMSPKGNFFSGRIAAICYMVQQGTEESQIEEMREGLLDEGWIIEDFLPEGWYVKQDKSSENFVYFTDDNVLLNSTEAASIYMKNSDRFNEREIDNIWKYNSSLKNEDEGKGHPIKDIKLEGNNGEHTEKSPHKMPVRKNYKCDVCGKGFPMGGEWKYKKHMEGHIKEEENMEGEDIVKDEGLFMDESMAPAIEIKEEDNILYPIQVDHEYVIDEQKVPRGWKRKFKFRNENDIRRKIYIITPEGTSLSGVINALLYMQKNNYSAADIAIVEQNLLDDGWYVDECLPKGWYMRPIIKREAISVCHFLTNEFQIFRSFKTVREFLKQFKEYGIDATKKITSKLEEVSKTYRKLAWNDESTCQLPEGWKLKLVKRADERVSKFFCTSDGTSIHGTIQALQYMIKNNYHESDIELITPELKEEGWITDLLLPKGWYMKSERNPSKFKGRYFYLTNTFQPLRSNMAALDLLRNDKETQTDTIGNFLTLLKQNNLKVITDGWIVSDNQNSPTDPEIVLNDLEINISQYDCKEYTLPENWILKVIPKKNGRIAKLFLSPEGERLQCVISALQFMVKNKYPVNDIELIAKLLKDEGWITDELLPNGWYMKLEGKRSDLRFNYLTDSFQILRSNITALEALQSNENTTEEVKQNFTTLLKQNYLKGAKDGKHRSLKANEDKLDCSDDKLSVPTGWKVQPIPTRKGKFVVLSPDGTKFEAIRSALKFMVETKFSREDIEMMSKHLIKENWEPHELMPNGWYIRKSSKSNYLTDVFELFQSNAAALDYLKNNGKSTEKDINNFMAYTKQMSLQGSAERWNWSEGNASIPEGWKIRSNPNDNRKTYAISPTGMKFDCIRTALQYMASNDSKKEDIQLMSKYLIKESWEAHELLPKGWYIKSTNKGNEFLTDDFQHVRSNAAALTYLQNSGATKEDIGNFMHYVNKKSWEASKEKWNWSEVNEHIPDGWQIGQSPIDTTKHFVISPNGVKFDSVSSALKYMLENKYIEKDIEVMRKILIKEGWETHNLLPKGWYAKFQYEKKSDFSSYLTDIFEHIKSNTVALDVLKNNDKSTEQDVQNLLAFIKLQSAQNSERKHNWSKGNESVPQGWKIRPHRNNANRHYVLSPTGVKFECIRSALQDMVKNNCKSEDIQIMAKYLIKESWETHELLPEGWYRRALGKKGFNYLNEDFELIRSNTTALHILKNNGKSTKEDVQNFIKLLKPNSSTENEGISTLTEDNEVVPIGWQLQAIPTQNGKFLVVSPDGVKFDAIRSALEYMVENSYGKEDIHIMAKHLIKENWKTHELLPKGWYMRPNANLFLTDIFQCVKSNTEALDNLKHNGRASTEDIGNFMLLVNKRSLQGSEERWDWSEGNESVPVGWKLRTCPTNDRKHYVLSPTGMKFESIRKALQYMSQNNWNEEDVQIMSKHLQKESWETHELLPKGWYRRVSSRQKLKNKNYFIYLSESFEILESNTTALHVLKTNGKCTKEDVQNFMKLLKPKSVESNADEFNWCEENEAVPDGWQLKSFPTQKGRFMVISPDKNKFDSIRSALKFMVEKNFNSEDIGLMSKHLSKENWEPHDLLPKDWYLRSTTKEYQYLTNDFQLIKSNTLVLEKLKSCSQEYIANFMLLLHQKSSQERWSWSEENENIPKGWMIRTSPTDTRKHYVLSPTGIKFNSIRKALQYMAQNTCENEDIQTMSKNLFKEKWETHDNLPVGWYRRSTSKGNEYLTDKFDFVKSNNAALEILERNGTREDIEKIMIFMKRKYLQETEEKWNWSEGNGIAPEGWKIRTSPKNSKKHFVISPTGMKFESIRKALQYMTQNNYKKQDIQIMSKYLLKESWETHKFLPEGWYRRYHSKGYHFLTDDFDLVKSNPAAFKLLTNNGKATNEEIDNFIILLKSKPSQITKTEFEPKSSLVTKEELFDANENMPEGWQLQIIPASGKFIIISSNGDKFEGFRSALTFMVQNNYSKNDIEVMARNLTKSGWQTNELLPTGWYMKSEKSKIHKFNYLTDKFKLVQSNVAALNVLESDKNVTKAMVLNFLTLVKQISMKPSEESKNWSEEYEILPVGWKMKTCLTISKKHLIISPDGRKFEAIKSTLRYMVENNYQPQDIEVMAKHLDKEGWEMHSLLPKGWYMKDELDNSLQFLTNEFQHIKTDTDAMEVLTNDPYSTTEDMQSFFTLVKLSSSKESEENESIKKEKEIVNERKFQKKETQSSKPLVKEELNVISEQYNWMESDGTFPVSWKKRVKNTFSGKQYVFFLLPDGISLQGRANALKHLVNNGYPRNDIENMRESLRLEGWQQNQSLPQHWLQKKSPAGLEIKILSPSGQLFLSMKAVSEYMEKYKIGQKHTKVKSVKREAEENPDLEKIGKKMVKDKIVSSVKREVEEDTSLEQIKNYMEGKPLKEKSIKREADEKPDVDKLRKKMRVD